MIGQMQMDIEGKIADKIETAIRRLQAFEPEEGYYVAFSGGKDSQCIYHLCKAAGVKFDAHYNVTSVDPPELIYFIREHYPDVIWDVPHDKDGKRISMWSLIKNHAMPPTRKVRYCCADLKECNGKGRIVVTGVRWAESVRRKKLHGVVSIKGRVKATRELADKVAANYKVLETKKDKIIMNDDNGPARQMVEHCYRTQKTMLNPIVDWDDKDVWEYLNDIVRVPHCKLYDDGLKRLGCIGCPMQSLKKQRAELERYPKYKALYLTAFGQMLENRSNKNLETTIWHTPEDVMEWWLARYDKTSQEVEAID